MKELVDFYMQKGTYNTARAGPRLVRRYRPNAGPSTSSRAHVGNLGGMVELMSILVRSCGTASDKVPPTLLPGLETPLSLHPDDQRAVLDSAFLAQLLRDGVQLVMAIDILKHWSYENKQKSREFLTIVLEGIQKVEHPLYRYYFSVLLELFEIDDSVQTWRVDMTMVGLLRTIKNQLHSKEPVLTCIKFTKKLGKRNEKAKQWLSRNKANATEVLEHHPWVNEPEKPGARGSGAVAFLQKTRGMAIHK